jgi:hypothetical protein
MSEQDMMCRIDALIEDLILAESVESAAVASILLAARAALRDGLATDAARLLWCFLDMHSHTHRRTHTLHLNGNRN